MEEELSGRSGYSRLVTFGLYALFFGYFETLLISPFRITFTLEQF